MCPLYMTIQMFSSEMFYQSTPIKQIFGERELTKGLKSTSTLELYRLQNLRVILSLSAAKAMKYSTHPQNQH